MIPQVSCSLHPDENIVLVDLSKQAQGNRRTYCLECMCSSTVKLVQPCQIKQIPEKVTAFINDNVQRFKRSSGIFLERINQITKSLITMRDETSKWFNDQLLLTKSVEQLFMKNIGNEQQSYSESLTKDMTRTKLEQLAAFLSGETEQSHMTINIDEYFQLGSQITTNYQQLIQYLQKSLKTITNIINIKIEGQGGLQMSKICNSLASKQKQTLIADWVRNNAIECIEWEQKELQFIESTFQKKYMEGKKLTRAIIRQRETIMNVIRHLSLKVQEQLCLIEQYREMFDIIYQLDAEKMNSFIAIQMTQYRVQKIQLKPNEYVTIFVTCNQTCHYPCGIRDDQSKRYCTAMQNDNCTICQNKCPWSSHFNLTFRIETRDHKEEFSGFDLRESYIESKSTKTLKEYMLNFIIKKYEQVQLECMELQFELMQAVNTLNQIALQPAICTPQEEYVKITILEESIAKNPGWKERIAVLENMRYDWKTLREIANDCLNQNNKRISPNTNQITIVFKRNN